MILKKRVIFLLLGIFAVMLFVSGCGKANIGYFDGERIMKESPQLQSLVAEGNGKLADLQKQAADLSQKKDTMSEDDFKKAQTEQQTQISAVRQQYSAELKQKVDVAVEEISKNKKLDSVVDNEGDQKVVIQGGTDITDEVIQKLQ